MSEASARKASENVQYVPSIGRDLLIGNCSLLCSARSRQEKMGNINSGVVSGASWSMRSFTGALTTSYTALHCTEMHSEVNPYLGNSQCVFVRVWS